MSSRDSSRSDVVRRAEELFEQHDLELVRHTNRLFGSLMIAQWIFAVVLSLVVSPVAWAGRTPSVHVHVVAALLLGGAIALPPIFLAYRRTTWWGTKHVLSVAQVLWSALLIHLTGGRIETHFHVFGSLAFIAFYRDYRVLLVPTFLVVVDHLVRGLFWPESVYGDDRVQAYRFLEHAGWVVFEDVVLILSCIRGRKEMHQLATQQAALESLSHLERAKAAELEVALRELQASQGALVRAEKLAAIGRLAASVGHELRNPLAAIRNAIAFVRRKVASHDEPKVRELLAVADREIDACGKIIGDLLDYARERPLVTTTCSLHALVEESLEIVQDDGAVEVELRIPTEVDAIVVDRDLFRQVFVNLLQNAIEATPAGGGRVTVSATPLERGDEGVAIRVEDQGTGMTPEVAAQVFEPLFTTKSKGTGLGLAIVANMIRRHGGTIRVDSRLGHGSIFHIELPVSRNQAVA